MSALPEQHYVSIFLTADSASYDDATQNIEIVQ